MLTVDWQRQKFKPSSNQLQTSQHRPPCFWNWRPQVIQLCGSGHRNFCHPRFTWYFDQDRRWVKSGRNSWISIFRTEKLSKQQTHFEYHHISSNNAELWSVGSFSWCHGDTSIGHHRNRCFILIFNLLNLHITYVVLISGFYEQSHYEHHQCYQVTKFANAHSLSKVCRRPKPLAGSGAWVKSAQLAVTKFTRSLGSRNLCISISIM